MSAEVAVIVVTFQPGPELEPCLRSVERELAGVPFELWVVDNASGDGTAGRVRAAHPGARVIDMPSNAGFAAANNRALAESQAANFLLLNPDAEMLPGSWGALKASLAVHPRAGALAPHIEDESGGLVRSLRTFPSLRSLLWENTLFDVAFPRHPLLDAHRLGAFDYAAPRAVDSAGGACLLVPRSALERVGAMDPGYFMYSEEMDWCRRMHDAGLEVWFEPAARVRHLGQRSSGRYQDVLIPAYYRSQRRYFGLHGTAAQRALWPVLTLLGVLVRAAAFTARRLSGSLDGPGFRLRMRAYARAGMEALRSGVPV